MSIFRNQRVYFPLIGVCFLVSSLIALNTNNYHPDEGMHIDAFCYFERHWWAPSVNSDEVWYGQDGWSRVYNGELVYQVYGRLSQFISPLRVGLILLGARTLPVLGVAPPQLFIAYNSQQTSLQCHETTYRLFNSCLLVITLFLLFRAGTTHGLAIILALMLICIDSASFFL